MLQSLSARGKSQWQGLKTRKDFRVVAQPLRQSRSSLDRVRFKTPVAMRALGEIRRQGMLRCTVKPSVLCGGHLITLATLDGVEIDAADHHGQRHGIDFDRQRVGVPALGYLEAASFESLRPDDEAIVIPIKDLASITRSIQEDEVIAMENVFPKCLGDDRAQAVEALPHVRRQCVDKNAD